MCEKHGPIKTYRDKLFDMIMPKDLKIHHREGKSRQ